MSPSPPRTPLAVAGAPLLASWKCTLGAPSRVFLARASRSCADSPGCDEVPPLPAGPATSRAASSGTPARRSQPRSGIVAPPRGTSAWHLRVAPGPRRTGQDGSAPGRSDGGAGPRGDLGGDLRLVPERKEAQRRRQLGQPSWLG